MTTPQTFDPTTAAVVTDLAFCDALPCELSPSTTEALVALRTLYETEAAPRYPHGKELTLVLTLLAWKGEDFDVFGYDDLVGKWRVALLAAYEAFDAESADTHCAVAAWWRLIHDDVAGSA